MPSFQRRCRIAVPAEELFAWHAQAGAFERLIPPWERIELLERTGGIEDGARTVLRLHKGPLRLRWVAVHRDFRAGRQFVDEQVEGPFAAWRHTHRVAPERSDSSILEDEIDYRLPLGPLGDSLVGPFVRRDLDRTFRFRHRRTADDLQRHRQLAGKPRLRVAISGASGLIGRQLAAFLSSGGHSVIRLVRRAPRAGSGEIHWDPARRVIDATALDGVDAVVHLSGRSIAAWRWTRAVKRDIWESRVETTRLLADALAGLKNPPRTLIAASAVGYYGDRGDEVVSEESGPGSGFLADLCQAWEEASKPAQAAGIRVVNLRTGLVLTAAGGVLRRLLLPFRLGLGGVLGDGRQVMSWIALDDVLGAILQLLFATDLSGPVNTVSPLPVTNREFTETLGSVLRRPTLVPTPAPLLRALFGEMGQALFLEGSRVRPRRLSDDNRFQYLYPDLERALRHELGYPLPDADSRSAASSYGGRS